MLCDGLQNGLADGQVQVGFLDGDLGVARTPCVRSTLGLAAGGGAIIETANLYGHLAGGATLRGSWAVSTRTALYASVEAVRYDGVIAPISSSALGPGYTDLGVTTDVVHTEHAAVAVQATAVLPTAVTLNRHGAPLSADLGVIAAWSPTRAWTVHGSALGLGTLAAGGGPLFPAAGAHVDAGAEWRPTGGFGLVADVLAGFGYTAPVDVVAVGVGVRGAIGPHAGLALEVNAPVAGRERTLAALDLRLDWRL